MLCKFLYYYIIINYYQTCPRTCVDHHEALANWRPFHLTGKSVQLFIFYIISMHAHLLLPYTPRLSVDISFLKHRINHGRVVVILCRAGG